MPTKRTPTSCLRGFTLIEIVIGLVLLGILGIVGTKMIGGSFFTNEVISKTNMAYSKARYGLERMAREIREVDDTGSLQITTWTATQLSFTKTGPQGPLAVSFTHDTVGGTLSMAYTGTVNGITYDGTPHVLVENISNIKNFNNALGAFSYYQDIGADATNSHAATATANLHYVFINFKVKPDPALNQVLTLSSLIYLRNL